MIHHVWTLPCRVVISSQETNNVSLIEILEEISIKAQPIILQGKELRGIIPAIFDIVTLWAREKPDQPDSGFGRISLISPDGETIFLQESEIDLKESKRMRSVGRIFGFPAEQDGIHFLKVEIRSNSEDQWVEVWRIPIEVTIERPPQVQANVETP